MQCLVFKLCGFFHRWMPLTPIIFRSFDFVSTKCKIVPFIPGHYQFLSIRPKDGTLVLIRHRSNYPMPEL